MISRTVNYVGRIFHHAGVANRYISPIAGEIETNRAVDISTIFVVGKIFEVWGSLAFIVSVELTTTSNWKDWLASIPFIRAELALGAQFWEVGGTVAKWKDIFPAAFVGASAV